MVTGKNKKTAKKRPKQSDRPTPKPLTAKGEGENDTDATIQKMPKALSDSTLDLIADRFKILGDPLRLRILRTLQVDEHSVSEIVAATGAGQANVSRHLQLLSRAGIVARRKEGLHVFYRMSDPTIIDLCEVVCDSLAERLSRDLEAIRKAT